MQDDQWNYPPKRGSSERLRPGGGNSGPLSGQRPGASRPFNATGQGRQMGNPNNSSIGPQRAASGSFSQGPWRDDGPGQPPQQRRGPSGPINPGPARGGTGNTRTSRGLTPPTGRPAVGGRGQTGQWGNNQRGWDDDEDWEARPPRSASGKQAANGRTAAGGRGQPQMRKGTTVRDNWVIETDVKYKAPGSSLRVRLLFLLLAAVIALGAGIYFVPGAKSRLLGFLPGPKSANTTTTGGNGGTLTLQVNAPSATITLDTKTYKTTAGQTAPFSSVAIPGLTAGNHNITIHADTYTDFTGQLQMPGTDATMTAWLAPSADQLTALGAQFKPATQPAAGAAGDHYNATSRATGKINISIKYTLSGLTATSYTGQLVQNGDIKTVPFKAATLALVPDITFTTAAGTKLYEYKPKALATSKFALQMPLAYDAKGALQFGAPTVALPSNVTVDFAGPSKSDYALYFALASILPTTTKALKFICVGAVNKTTFNPEDGLLIVETKDDATHAHYFYRWGLLWATNTPAFNLTPSAPHALAGSNEFNDANTARLHGSCGN
jgi:hypothetical protein